MQSAVQIQGQAGMARQPVRPADKTAVGMDQRMQHQVFRRPDRPDALGKRRAAHRHDALGREHYDIQAVGRVRTVLDVDVVILGEKVIRRRRRPEDDVQLRMLADER